MTVARRRLLAGGVGAAALAVGTSARGLGVPPDATLADVDLSGAPYSIVPNDEGEALRNSRQINRAIIDHPANVRLSLPPGIVYVALDPAVIGKYRFAAIRVVGVDKRRLMITGAGSSVTSLVITGSQNNGLSQILQIADGPQQIQIRDLSFAHGPGVVDIDTAGLQNHQIELNALQSSVTDVCIENVDFGTCVGDAIRLAGGEEGTGALLSNTTIRAVTMRLAKHPAAPKGCRSGISLQKGIQGLRFSDFYIVGAKNSGLDCEPTAHGVMDDIHIFNGTIDNTQSDTPYAASFAGFEDNAHRTSFLTNSSLTNVQIKGGQLQIVSTRGCSVADVMVEVAGGPFKAADEPVLLVYRENEDLSLRDVNLHRAAGSPPGPIAVVQNIQNNSRRVSIEGGTWRSDVSAGKERSHIRFVGASDLQIRGTRVRITNSASTSNIVQFRPSGTAMNGVSLHEVVLEGPDGIANAVAFVGVDHAINSILVTGCTFLGGFRRGILFDATGAGSVDQNPIVQANHFGRCARPWDSDRNAGTAVFPVITGNVGGPCTLSGSVEPNGLVAAPVGSQFVRDGMASLEVWWKTRGAGTSGWVTMPLGPDQPAPENLVSPFVHGDALVGRTLAVDRGTWNPGGLTYSYQWLRNGTPILGATHDFYVVTAGDIDARLSVRVTASDSSGRAAAATTQATLPVARPAIAPPPPSPSSPSVQPGSPRIRGTVRVGGVLRCLPGTWSPSGAVVLRYQWTQDGSAIAGATRSTYRVRRQDRRHRLAVTVVGSVPGQTPVSRTSSKTRRVPA